MSDVYLKFSSDDKDVIASLKRITAENEKLRAALKKAAEQAKKESQEVKKGNDEAAEAAKKAAASAKWLEGVKRKSAELEGKHNLEQLRATRALAAAEAQRGQASIGYITSAASSWISAAAAAATVTAELNAQLTAQKELAKFQSTAAGSQAGFLRNLGSVPQSERDALIAQVEGISRRTGVSQNDVYQAAGAAVSSRGSLTSAQALNGVEQAMRFSPDNPQEAIGVAAALNDLADVIKSADPKAAVAYLATLQNQSRATTLQQLTANAVPAAVGVAGFGATPAEAGALVTTLSAVGKDATNAQAGTAAIALASQLSDFLPDKDVFKLDQRGRKRLVRKGTGLDTLAERLEAVRSDPGLREQFLLNSSFEQKMLVPVRQMITGGSDAAKLYNRNVGDYLNPKAGAAAAEALIQGIQSQPLQQAADFQRKAAQSVEELKLKRLKAGESGAIYEAVNETYKSIGMGPGLRTLAEMDLRMRDIPQTPQQAAIGQLNYWKGAMKGGAAGMYGIDTSPDAIAALDRMIALLKSIDEKSTKPVRANIDQHAE